MVDVRSLIIEDEGWKNKAYKDTKGILTIGVGFNLEQVGLYDEEIEFILGRRIQIARAEAAEALGTDFYFLDNTRQAVLTSMAYQMGKGGLKKFKKTLQAIRAFDYEEAAREMLDSKWHREDSPNRAKRLSEAMKTGELK